MRRRDFLRGTGAALLGGVAGASTLWPANAQVAPAPAGPVSLACVSGGAPYWGNFCASSVNTGTTGPRKVLEIFLQGGVSPWESFYVTPDWRGHGSAVANQQYDASASNCYSPGPSPTTQSAFLGHDGLGQAVSLGPWVKPLWDGPGNLLDRTRVVVMNHDLTPHEAATPFAVAGKQVGRQGFCGMGVMVRRWAKARAAYLGTPRTVPASFSLVAGQNLGQPRFDVLGAVANHGGANRSLVIAYPSLWTGGIVDQLDRSSFKTPQADHLLDVYREMYRDRLRFGATSSADPGFVPRSRAFESYSAAVDDLLNADDLHSFLNSAPFPGPPVPADWCVGTPGGADPVVPSGALPKDWIRKRLEGAAFLLADSARDVRHVFVTDTGRHWDYDSHSNTGGLDEDHAFRTANNLYSLTSAIRDLVDSGAIDLDTTLIVLKTEFGRTPFPENGGNGRGHWPYGYVNVLIGGPTVQGVSGALTAGGAFGDSGAGVAQPGMGFSPADVQAALLTQAGVNPFEVDGFQISEMTGALQASSDEQTMTHVSQAILGVS